MVDLQKGARPEDKFELWQMPTLMKVSGNPYIYQTVKWYATPSDLMKDEPYFTVYILGYVTRWYSGKAKIDGTRTKMYWSEQLGTPTDPGMYVMNTWSKELASFRLHATKLDLYRWDNQGGI